ncbi:acyl carrier protein [Gemmobacter caeruleus]|uniref:acyl carrier protein n=1 Tax=Gemmobacter caeruleus TaxID=2595004 RepID=UPI0011ECF12A|nr:phosphopantetheine-binding protein [Gemmobacter caeruleus]
MTQNVTERVIAILADQAMMDPAAIRLEDTLADLGLDSLGLVESLFALEEAFDISVPFNANEPAKSDFDLSSVAAIIAAVEGLVAEARAA